MRRYFVAGPDDPAFVIDTAYSIDRTNTDCNLRWLYYTLTTLRLSELSNDVGVPGLSREAPYAACVPLVSREDQRRIADFLDDRVARIDRIITARREQMSKAQEAFEAARMQAVLGLDDSALVATDLPWAPKVGASRTVRRLGQMARMGTGHTPSRSNADYWVGCDIPWLTTGDVHRFRHDEIDVVEESMLRISRLGLANSAAVLHPAGTVALSRTASAGFSVIMGRDMATSQDYATWTCGDRLLPKFLLATLRVMRPYLLGNLAMGSTHKTIYFPDLQDLRAPVPDVNLQQVVVDEVYKRSEQRTVAVRTMTEQVARLAEYKTSLIADAVTGELDVTTAGSGVPE